MNIPYKANVILNVVLAGMLLIILRIWHLSVIQHEEKLQESRKPQQRIVMEPAKRGTISDRFDIPLAINKIRYNASILYSQIKQIPSVVWEKGPDGKKIRKSKRKEYIASLSSLLGEHLKLDPDRIEDLIHSKASFYQQVPFVLKEDITEEEYYRLKMLERSWPGILVQRSPRRYYTKGKVGADVVGYMGAINRQEYDAIFSEMKALQEYIEAEDIGQEVSLPPGIDSLFQAHKRLQDLQEYAYSINDYIGKAGIEGRYERDLRGFHGKRKYFSDAQGNHLKELSGSREPLAGKHLMLSISSELQEFAETLLVQNENIRITRRSPIASAAIKRTYIADKTPWIKGGAIVAIEPFSGEIIALASYPRFDPNDFIASGNPEVKKEKMERLHKWLESEAYLSEIWDGQRLLDKEHFDPVRRVIFQEEIRMDWNHYLDMVLAKDCKMKERIRGASVSDAIVIQRAVDQLLSAAPGKDVYDIFDVIYGPDGYRTYSKEHGKVIAEWAESHEEEIAQFRKSVDRYFECADNTYDVVLMCDLMRTAVDEGRFGNALLAHVGRQEINDYRQVCGAMVKVREIVYGMAKELFHLTHFKEWRKENEKAYLKEKRAEEKAARKYAKPYIDYLDAKEKELFSLFWSTYQWDFLTLFLTGKPLTDHVEEIPEYVDHFAAWHQEIKNGAHKNIDGAKEYQTLQDAILALPDTLVFEYMKSLRGFVDLNRPLIGRYRFLRRDESKNQQEKHLALAFYPRYGFGYVRSQAFRQSTPQGSIFKLVSAYAALIQKYRGLEESGITVKPGDIHSLNLLDMEDSIFLKGKELFVGNFSDGTPIPRNYRGGRLPRSHSTSLGKMDLLRAIEVSSNPYFSLLAGDYLESPLDLLDAATQMSYGERTGIDLPGEIPGNVPVDLETNRTGLYSFAIGQHTLVSTPLQTAVMLSSFANGGKIVRPKMISKIVGRDPIRASNHYEGKNYFPFQESLALVGIDFPLFVAADPKLHSNVVYEPPLEVKREIYLPEAVRRVLLEGMGRVIFNTSKNSLASLSRIYKPYPEAITAFTAMKGNLVGKTSTAELIENVDLDSISGTNIYTHVWFGGISYDQEGPSVSFISKDPLGVPDLVVIVYLRYGGFGKEAAPVAAQIIKKWKEIKYKSVLLHK